MFNIDYKDTDWQYLLVCATGITAGLAGWSEGFLLAIAFAAIQFFRTFLVHGQLAAFPVQVRIAYTALLVTAYAEPMNWLYWLPAIGTWIYILFNYCLLARLLSLLPFNSTRTFSLQEVRDTLLARPVKNIMHPEYVR